ncbi:MAG: hypothetical protein E8F57_05760, partial [Methylophaga nitratireducenticrescens]
KMQVWETSGSDLQFSAADIGVDYLGHIVENQHIQQQTLAAAQKHPQIDVICPAQPQQYQPGQLTLDNGQTLTAELIVAADGARSILREQAGIESRGWAYKQHGLWPPYILKTRIKKRPGNVFYRAAHWRSYH